MGVGTPGFEFQLTANRLGAAIISGIRRGAACPARRSGARRCWALRSRCLCQVLGPRIGGQAVGGPQRGPQASVLALGGLSRRINF